MNIINEKGLEDLCNAVVVLAAKDYRTHKGYLKKHPRTPELMAQVASDRAERERKLKQLIESEKDYITDQAYKRWLLKHEDGEAFDREAYRKSIDIPVPKRRFSLTKAEQSLERIIKHESAVKEIEDFFLSKWYTVLTEVDGEYLLNKLKEEFADESD